MNSSISAALIALPPVDIHHHCPLEVGHGPVSRRWNVSRRRALAEAHPQCRAWSILSAARAVSNSPETVVERNGYVPKLNPSRSEVG
jgi:hypothetical protein